MDGGAKGSDLFLLQVVDHAVGHLHRLPAGRFPRWPACRNLAGVGADEVGFQGCSPIANDQGLDLGPGVEGLGVHPDEEVAHGLAAVQFLAAADRGPADVVGEVVGELAPGDQRASR
jgi:hypothetical protein